MALLKRPSTRIEAALDPIKGSRFIATLDRAVDSESAMGLVRELRERWPDATHHCFAWRVDERTRRSSDDGEPGGTAGPPILRRMDSALVSQTVIVVTRYYGGTNLGCGGLVRAYGEAAAQALLQAQWVEEEEMARFKTTCPYGMEGPLRGLISRHLGEVTSARWEAQVHMDFAVPTELAQALERDFEELSAGKLSLEAV